MVARVYRIPEWKKRRIVKMRAETRLTQPEIARATDIHVSTVGEILRKSRKINETFRKTLDGGECE